MQWVHVERSVGGLAFVVLPSFLSSMFTMAPIELG